MAIDHFFKDLWRRIKAVEEDPWFLIGGFMVVVLLALLTVSASSFQPYAGSTDPSPANHASQR